VPFDQPEGESEIVAGYFLEYSGMKWGMFMIGEYIEFIFASALMVTLFFGGYHLPFLHPDGIHVAFGQSEVFHLPMSHMAVTVIHALSFFGKTILFAWFHLFIRWTLPRFRYDQLMKLGWTKLLPLALVNILLTGLGLLAIEAGGPTVTAAIDMLCDLSQALVALASLGAAVALITWMLEPRVPRPIVEGSSARFAAAAGGVKASEMTP
jgi:NADH-quinone oxidoreductase subunit H